MTEFLLILNLTALNMVIIHSLIYKNGKKEYKAPTFKIKKKHKLSEQEKRDAQILKDISNYNGMEVRK